MGLIFNGNGDVIKAVDGSLTVEGIDLGGSTNINAGIATFSGNVNVGGVLTYEDVKNVDSVGIVTARDHINIVTDNKKLQLGAGQDLTLHHDGTHNYVRASNTGQNLYLQTTDSQVIIGEDGGHIGLVYAAGGAVTLRHNNSNKFATTSTGAQIDTILLLYGAAGNPGRLRLQEGGALSEILVGRSSDTSSELSFATEISGTTAARAKIDTAGHFIPATDSTYDLGLTGTRWRNVYADTLYGNGSNLTGITQTTINNNANNRIITGSGTANTLEGEANLTFDGAELDINNSGGSARLYLVSGNSADSSIYFGRQNDGATGGIRYEHTDDSLRFMGYNNSERLRITSAGKVGINETSPQQQLHVHCDTAYEGILINGNAAPSVCFAANTGTTSEWKVGIPGQNNTYFGISTGNGNTNRLLMDTNGKTGLSGLPDTEVLTVNGATRWKYQSSNWGTGAEGAFIDYYASGSMVRLGHVSGASGSAKHIVFYSDGTERLRITSTGLITNKGTWTNTYAANDTTQCGYQAQNLSDTTNTYAALRLTAGSSSPATAQIASVRTGTGQNDLTIQLETSNTAFEALRINSSGNMGLGTGSGIDRQFHIQGTHPIIKLEDTGGGYSEISANTAVLSLRADAGNSQSSSYINFEVDGTERVRIKDDGTLYTVNKLGCTTSSPFSRLQVGNHTFSGGHGMYQNDRVGMSNHGSLTGLMLASTYNDSNHPEYGVVFVQGPTTSSYNVWSISPDGPAKGNSLNLHYGAQNTNIHAPANRKFQFTGGGCLLKPLQPRASILINSQTTISNAKVTNWASPLINVGSFWDTTNKRFVAPIAGVYMFGGNFRIGAPGHIRVVKFNLQLYTSGGTHYGTFGSGVGGSHNYDDSSSGYDHPYVSFTNMIELAAGAYVELHLGEVATQNTSYIQTNNHQSGMWGYLLM